MSNESSSTTTGNEGQGGYTMTSLSVEVIDYMILDDPNYYNSHVFTLQIWMEQNMYKIQRSYASFLELDSRLRRKYPRSALPALNLAGVKDKDKGSSSSSSKSSGSGGSSSSSGGGTSDSSSGGGGGGGGSSSSSSSGSKSKRFSITKALTTSSSSKDKDGGGGGGGPDIMNTRSSLYGNDLRASMIEVDPNIISPATTSSVTSSTTLSSASSSSSNIEGKQKKLLKRIDHHEVISSKKSLLSYYLRDLLKIPEVLVSSTLLYFLDEESNDGDMIVEDLSSTSSTTNSTEQQICYQTLLQDEVKTIKTVRKDFKLTIPVEEGQVVIWSFETKLRDIGFAVYFNEQNEVATYQRYNSHECKIFGCFEVPSLPSTTVEGQQGSNGVNNNKIELVWDNSYSKFHSKTLIYMTKVCSKETYDLVMMTSERMKQVKRQFAQQRKVLQRVLQKVATEILSGGTNTGTATSVGGLGTIDEEIDDPINSSGVGIRSSLVMSSGTTTTSMTGSSSSSSSVSSSSQYAMLIEQIEKLKNEKQFLQLAYSECETALVAERSACAEKQQQVDDLQLAKDLLDEELFETKSDLENARMELNEVITSQMTHTVAMNEVHKLSMEQLLAAIAATSTATTTGTAAGTAPAATVTTSDGSLIDINKPEIAIANFSQLLQYTYTLTQKLSEEHSLSQLQETTINKLKLEKKQLKALGIQLREKCDVLQLERSQLEHEKDLLVSQYQESIVREREREKEREKEEEQEKKWKEIVKERDREIEGLKQQQQVLLLQLQQQGVLASGEVSVPSSNGSSSIPVPGTVSSTTSSTSPSPSTSLSTSLSSTTTSMMEQQRTTFNNRLSFSTTTATTNTTTTTTNTTNNNNNTTSVSVSLEEINAAMVESAINNANGTSSSGGGGAGGGFGGGSSLDGGSIHSTDSGSTHSGVNPIDPYGFQAAANQPSKTIVIDFAKATPDPDDLSFLLTNMTSSLMDMMPSWGSSSSSAANANANATNAATSTPATSANTTISSPSPKGVDVTNQSSSNTTDSTSSTTGGTSGSSTTSTTTTATAASAPTTGSTTSNLKSRSGSITNSFTGSTFRGMTFGF